MHCQARYSGYSFVLTCYSLSLALCRDNIKTDFNQMNDNLNETSIQNTLLLCEVPCFHKVKKHCFKNEWIFWNFWIKLGLVNFPKIQVSSDTAAFRRERHTSTKWIIDMYCITLKNLLENCMRISFSNISKALRNKGQRNFQQ